MQNMISTTEMMPFDPSFIEYFVVRWKTPVLRYSLWRTRRFVLYPSCGEEKIVWRKLRQMSHLPDPRSNHIFILMKIMLLRASQGIEQMDCAVVSTQQPLIHLFTEPAAFCRCLSVKISIWYLLTIEPSLNWVYHPHTYRQIDYLFDIVSCLSLKRCRNGNVSELERALKAMQGNWLAHVANR